ncbi:hypothetical protein M9H77_35292 [Catharanthus roseus]|uniref:Uncharacterized protein n=1 Tax=Catharanthus roseus TaxID=4058 RepID=A0ACB9ZQR5_CATRO|nr:hypothetical protein M9H77_35292 [Catharanthus roseus]
MSCMPYFFFWQRKERKKKEKPQGIGIFDRYPTITVVNKKYDVHSVRGLHCTWLVPRTRASSDGVDDSDSEEWIHLKRVYVDITSCNTVGFDRLVKSQEGLETEVGPRINLVVHFFCNQAFVWCLAGIDYEMPELGSDGLVLGIRTLSVKPHCCHTLARDGQGPSKPLKEIVPEKEPISVIDLSNDESIGLEMAPVASGIGLGTSIKEDHREPTSDSERIPELERVTPAAAGDMGTCHYHHYFGVGSGSMTSVATICGVSSRLRPLDSRL